MYGIIQKLLKEEYDVHETVLIESPFREKTRKGKFCRTVVLDAHPCRPHEHFYTSISTSASQEEIITAEKKRRKKLKTITPINLVVAAGQKGNSTGGSKGGLKIRILELCSLYPLRLIDLTIFERTRKQSIKLTYNNNVARYFELGQMAKRKIFWKIWCLYVNEIRRGLNIWPYCDFEQEPSKYEHRRWTDKYLYLGPQRHTEDQIRPTPIPGLGPSEEIKLSYLKPQYFGCWDQSEHWVQCDEAVELTCDYDVFTYTGVPTSNVTYTPLTTTHGDESNKNTT